MNIKQWPAHERLRERILKHGTGGLSDAELLAIVLGSGRHGQNAVDLARTMLSQFGSLRGLLQADEKSVCAFAGVGQTRYAILQAVTEIARRSLMETMMRGSVLSNPSKAHNYLLMKMRDCKHETFACLFLDSRNRVIAFEEMFKGTIGSVSIHPREIVKRSLHHNAAAIIFAHNHPSGSSYPSRSDKYITRELKESLRLIDVRVLDHFVIGENVTSLPKNPCCEIGSGSTANASYPATPAAPAQPHS